MADPLTPTVFLNALRAEGLSVVTVGSWSHHNRNKVGLWGPVHGVVMHHTGPWSTEAGMVNYCYNGSPPLPGPLCHGVIDRQGTVHLVGYGRTNHAGGGDPNVLQQVTDESYALTPSATRFGQGDPGATDGNRRFYGFECINSGSGSQTWPAAQVEAMVRAGAAICRAHGWGYRSVIGHLEWSNQKSDPKGITMPYLRTRIAERLTHPSSWSPGATTAYTVKRGDTLRSIAKAKLGNADRYSEIAKLNRLADPNDIEIGQELKLPAK